MARTLAWVSTTSSAQLQLKYCFFQPSRSANDYILFRVSHYIDLNKISKPAKSKTKNKKKSFKNATPFVSNKTLSRQLVKPFRHSGAGDWRRLFCRERLTEGNRVQLHPSQVLLSCGMRPPMAQVRQRTGVERSALRNAHHRLRKDLKPTNQLHLQQNSSTTDLEPFLRTSHTPGQVRYSSVCKMPGSLSDVYSYRRQHRAWCKGKKKTRRIFGVPVRMFRYPALSRSSPAAFYWTPTIDGQALSP